MIRKEIGMSCSTIDRVRYLAQSTPMIRGTAPFVIALPKLVPFFSWKNSPKNQLIHIGIMIQSSSEFWTGAAKMSSQSLKKCQMNVSAVRIAVKKGMAYFEQRLYLNVLMTWRDNYLFKSHPWHLLADAVQRAISND